VTGDYSRSLALDVGVSAGGVSVTVGTTRPQARRLEFGAQGVDSLGRRMNSPPYPHFGPAFDKVAPQFLDALERIVDQD
jgi:hypothetical protein